MKQKIKTMEELSEVIGISRPTLSKYFQNQSSVRSSTRSKIETALANIDYVPNFFARNLNRKQTKLIGVVIPHLSDLFYMDLVEAIEQTASKHEHKVIIQNSHGKRELELAALDNLRSMNADGALVAPIGSNKDVEAFHRIAVELPLVFFDSQLTDGANTFPFVGTDNQQSIELLVDYLSRSGSAPVLLAMPDVNNNSEERTAVYLKRMRELGLEPDIIEVNGRDVGWAFEEYGYQRMKDLFAKGRYRSATILCPNDRLAMGALAAANEADLFGKNSGFRISGHDDHPLSGYVWPSLTTVAQNTEEIGRAAFKMLMRSNDPLEDNAKPKVHLLPAQLVLRNSA